MRLTKTTSLASLLLLGCFIAVAEAAIYNVVINSGGRQTVAPGVWLPVEAVLYKDRKPADWKNKFDHNYNWFAYSWADWEHYERTAKRGGPPACGVQGVWAHGPVKHDATNSWQATAPGDYALVCMTSKTMWSGAGVIRIRVGAAAPAPVPVPGPGPRPARTVTKIAVTPEAITLQPGQCVDIQASAVDQNGRVMRREGVELNCGGGGTLAGNRFTAGPAPGRYQIWAKHAGSGIARVIDVTIVQPCVVTRIVATPANAQLFPGQAVVIQAAAYDQFGKPIAAALEYVAGKGGRFVGNTFHAGPHAGNFQAWVRHRETNVAAVIELQVVQPVTLTHLTFREPILRARSGQQVRLELQAWDQYNRPMAVPGACSWGCSRRARLSEGVFWAPRDNGHYQVVVTDPTTGVKAIADIFVHD